MKRILVLFLALTLALLSLASCTPDDDEVTGTKLPSTEDDWYHAVDFGGQTIAIRYHNGDATVYTKGPDNKGSDSVLDRCYDRNLAVKATLNLKVDPRVGENTPTYMNEIALMPTGAPDFVIMPNDQTISLALQGFIRDAKKTPAGETTYFDFTAKCWYNDFMGGLVLDENQYFGIAGDYFIDVIREAECLYMNTTYYEQKMTDSLDDFYSRVERGNFDADYMQYMIELAYEDNTNQGYVDEGDRLGLIWRQGISFYPWVYGTDTAVIEKNDSGEWNVIDNPTTFGNLVDKLIKVCTAQGAYSVSNISGGTDAAKSHVMDMFRENKALFAGMFRMGDLENSKMLSMSNKIAVVYPIMNESQYDYRTYVNYEAEVGMIPVQAKQNFTEISAYMQLLNEQSSDIVDQYFEESLKFKYSTEAVGAGRMLDVIYDSIGSSAYKNIMDAARDETGMSMDELPQFVYVVLGSVSAKQNNFAADWASYRDAYRTGLNSLKQKFANMAN